jgi:hypothetical protein
LAAVGLYLADMLRQIRRLDTEDPENCLTLFRANRDTGLIEPGLHSL